MYGISQRAGRNEVVFGKCCSRKGPLFSIFVIARHEKMRKSYKLLRKCAHGKRQGRRRKPKKKIFFPWPPKNTNSFSTLPITRFIDACIINLFISQSKMKRGSYEIDGCQRTNVVLSGDHSFIIIHKKPSNVTKFVRCQFTKSAKVTKSCDYSHNQQMLQNLSSGLR